MEMRVEQLSARSEVSVDTIRYYQSKGLLEPPRREGRVAWYDDSHLHRLQRIRTLQQKGFTLATIARLLSGDLDAADEALLNELAGIEAVPEPAHPDQQGETTGSLFSIEDLAVETGVPLALLSAVEAEGLLVPRRVGNDRWYTQEDVAAARAGLLLLEWGIPLSALLDVARRHNEATTAVAREAVGLFSTYVRRPLREQRSVGSGEHDTDEDTRSDDADVDRLARAYAELLPAVNTLVANHFSRILVACALDHVEQVGSEAERRATSAQLVAEQL
jgi:DNA-binding transcriptional MerR regulator